MEKELHLLRKGTLRPLSFSSISSLSDSRFHLILLLALQQPWAPTPPAMLINGNSSLGKTAVVKSILSTTIGHMTPSRYAFLDCVECHTPRLIFEHAIYQLQNAPKTTRLTTTCAESQLKQGTLDGSLGSSSRTTNDEVQELATNTARTAKEPRKRKRTLSHEQPVWNKCENVNEFVEWCRKICDSDTSEAQATPTAAQGGSSRHHDTRYIVLDRAERLRDTAPALIPVLMRLQELVSFLDRSVFCQHISVDRLFLSNALVFSTLTFYPHSFDLT